MQKNQTGPLSYTVHKNKLKKDKDSNARPETIKLLEENANRIIFDICLNNNFFDLAAKAKINK